MSFSVQKTKIVWQMFAIRIDFLNSQKLGVDMNVRYIHVHDTDLNEYRYSVQVTHCLLIFPCTRITYYTKQINAD